MKCVGRLGCEWEGQGVVEKCSVWAGWGVSWKGREWWVGKVQCVGRRGGCWMGRKWWEMKCVGSEVCGQ